MDNSLLKIGKGAAGELFERELQDLLANMGDVNTEAEKDRKITLEFVFHPFSDRTSATVEIRCKSNLASASVAKSNVFVVKRGGRLELADVDPRQVRLFEPKQETPPEIQ